MNRLVLVLAACLAFLPAARAADPATLEQTLAQQGRFTTYLAIRNTAGALPRARGKQTFLVPNDASLAQLPAQLLARLQSEPALARAFLGSLTLRGDVRATDLGGARPGRSRRHTTALGTTITVAAAAPVEVVAPPTNDAPPPAPPAPPAVAAPLADTSSSPAAPAAPAAPADPPPPAAPPAPAPAPAGSTPPLVLSGGQIAGINLGAETQAALAQLQEAMRARSTSPAPSPASTPPPAVTDVQVTGGTLQEVTGDALKPLFGTP